MIFRGEYIILGSGLVIPNVVTQEGAQLIWEMAFRGSDSEVAEGGNFYLGLTGESYTPDSTHTMADLADEPSSTGSYARQAITRDAAGWPTVDISGGLARARSEEVDFTAVTDPYDRAISRLFLCTSASGSSGKLISVSAPFPEARTISPGSALSVAFQMYSGE